MLIHNNRIIAAVMAMIVSLVVITACGDELERENPERSDSAQELTVWKTVRVGGISKDELLRRLDADYPDIYTTPSAVNFIRSSAFTTTVEVRDINFGRATLRELGFTRPPTTYLIFKRLREVADFCQPEDGPYLRLADHEQYDEYFPIIDYIDDFFGYPHVFQLSRLPGGSRWLHLWSVLPGEIWGLDDSIVFRLRE